MKRASLTVAPARPKTDAPDLTDRLLSRGGSPAPQRIQPKPAAAARPKAKAAPVSPRVPKAPPTPQPSSIKSSREAVQSVDEALSKSRAALDALKAAAGEAPARYEIALRYRLDALAHHIRQVTEFLLQTSARK